MKKNITKGQIIQFETLQQQAREKREVEIKKFVSFAQKTPQFTLNTFEKNFLFQKNDDTLFDGLEEEIYAMIRKEEAEDPRR